MASNYAAEIATLKANDENIFHQLTEIKSEIKDISRLTSAVEKIAVQTENTSNKVDALDNRLETIEKKPSEDASYYKRVIIGGIITTVIGIIIGAIFTQILR